MCEPWRAVPLRDRQNYFYGPAVMCIYSRSFTVSFPSIIYELHTLNYLLYFSYLSFFFTSGVEYDTHLTITEVDSK